jgi:hypothetical protein
MLTANQVLSRVYDEEQKALNVATPENAVVEALASARVTSASRTSSVLTNRHGRGLLILIDVTEIRGTGALTGVTINSVYEGKSYAIADFDSGPLPIAAVSQIAVGIYPGIADGDGYYKNKINPGREYAITVSATADGAGNDVTYSVSVIHLL